MPYADREARVAYAREYTKRNRAKHHAKWKAKYNADPDYYRKRSNDWYHGNKEIAATMNKRRYRRTRKTVIAKTTAYREAHKEHLRQKEKERQITLYLRYRELDWRKRGIKDLTYDKFLALYELQGRKCVLCSKALVLSGPGIRGSGNTPALDHDHATGKVRGILCNCCNFALGHAKDSPTLLRRMADYLEHHKNQTKENENGNENRIEHQPVPQQ